MVAHYRFLESEMRALGSLIMRAADGHQVPAGGALAVDRESCRRSATYGRTVGGRGSITP